MATLNYGRERRAPLHWDRRGLLLAVGAFELLFAVLAYAGASWLVVIYQLASDGALLLVWVAAAAGWGAILLAPLPGSDAGEGGGRGALRFSTLAALGLGLMALAVLGLGLAGWLNRALAVALIAVGLVLGGVVVWRRWGDVLRGDFGAPLREWLGAPAGWHWLWLLVLPLLAVALVGACVPPGMLWHPHEPHGYDVAEYHFQVPREWYEAGQIVPLRHNAFSFFPFNVEMHYLLAMHLRGGPWKGMYLAQLMHVGYVVLSVVAVYGLASSLAPTRAAAVVGAVAAASVPWLALLGPVGYNEGGLLLYGALAVGWVVLAVGAPPRAALARFGVAGAMAGLACGVKLTAVPMVLVALPVAALLFFPRLVRPALLFVAVGAVVFAPWLLRNVAWAGNPVFPEAAGVLGRAHFTDAQVERWERAHSPRADQRSLPPRLLAAGQQIVWNWRFGFVALPLAVLSVRPGNKGSAILALLLLLLLLFWLTLTHLQGRFFVLAIPVVGLMVATATWGRWLPGVAAASAVLAVVSWAMVHREFTDRLYGAQWVGVLCAEDLTGLTPPQTPSVPPDATLVLVGEARAFWYQRPMRLLRYRTVFDVDASNGSGIVDAWRGGSRESGEWLLIDTDELRRFHRTYHAIPALPPELQGQTQHLLVPPK